MGCFANEELVWYRLKQKSPCGLTNEHQVYLNMVTSAYFNQFGFSYQPKLHHNTCPVV